MFLLARQIAVLIQCFAVLIQKAEILVA